MVELEPMTSSSRGCYTRNLSECNSADGLAAVIASCSPLALQGASMEEAKCHKRALFPVFEACEDTGDEDICEVESTTGAGGAGGATGQHVEKKRRLSVEQVKSLEKNFELENKLEPDRKIQLAKELGLQPRQVAVWFQNRRARWKTKQLEKDYDLLKLEYDELNTNYKVLMQEKEKLEEQMNLLKEKLTAQGQAMMHNAEEAGAAGREVDDELNCLLPKIATSTSKVSTTPAAVMNYLKEGSSSSDSDASEVLEADSPLASRLSVVNELHKAIPASSMSMSVTTSVSAASASASAAVAAAAEEALNFGDPPSAAAAVASSASFFYFATDFQHQQQRSSLMKVEDWGLEEQGAMLPWWTELESS